MLKNQVKTAKNITLKRKIGDLGEDIAEMFHVEQGFKVIARNYQKKWGEIDIILKKGAKLHFIEVKTVSCENITSVARETDRFRPEDNLHPWKLKRLLRTIQSYVLEKGLENSPWQLDAAIVYLDIKRKKVKIEMISNIII